MNDNLDKFSRACAHLRIFLHDLLGWHDWIKDEMPNYFYPSATHHCSMCPKRKYARWS